MAENEFDDILNDLANTENDNNENEDNEETEETFGEDIDNRGTGNKAKQAIKQAAIIVFVGIVLCMLAYLIVKIFSGGNTEDKKVDNIISTTSSATYVESETQSEAQAANDDTDKISSESINNTSDYNNVNIKNNDWIAFTNSDSLLFNEQYVESVFTITKIDNLAKLGSENDAIAVQTKLTGTLSGFIGSFELIVPYEKGRLLSLGNSFSVSVQVGSLGEKVVVGDIKY